MDTNTTCAPGTANDTDITPSLPDDGLNHRQRIFADLYLAGHFANKAAIHAGYSAENASRIATRLLKTPAVAAYIAGERQRLASESFYSRRLLVDWLWKVIHTSIDDVREGNNIVQEITTREAAGTLTRRIKMVNKLAALRQLARMQGYDKPELCLPGDLAGIFQAFQVADPFGQASPPSAGPANPPPTAPPTGQRLPSDSSLDGTDRSPGDPVGAAHPSSDDEGPDQHLPSTSSLQGTNHSPGGPAGAAHPNPPGQGPDQRLSSTLAPQSASTTPASPPDSPITPSNLASAGIAPAASTHKAPAPNLPPDFPPYQPTPRRRSPSVSSPIPL